MQLPVLTEAICENMIGMIENPSPRWDFNIFMSIIKIQNIIVDVGHFKMIVIIPNPPSLLLPRPQLLLQVLIGS